jgi:hypothetical protein
MGLVHDPFFLVVAGILAVWYGVIRLDRRSIRRYVEAGSGHLIDIRDREVSEMPTGCADP